MKYTNEKNNCLAKTAISIILILIMFAAPISCINRSAENTCMVDKTSEKDVNVPQSPTVAFTLLTQPEYRALADLTCGKYCYEGLEYGELEDQESVMNAAKQAIMDFYGNDFIDFGQKKKTVICKSGKFNDVWVYYNECIYVVLKPKNGELLLCIDSRIQGRFMIESDRSDNSKFKLKANIFDCTEDELRLYRTVLILSYPVQKPFGELQTAQSAYEAAVDIAKSITVGALSGSGREYVVYFSEKSNAWIVIGTKITMALSKETGEVLYMGRTIK